jgi:outer membrane lipoprotein SlyB
LNQLSLHKQPRSIALVIATGLIALAAITLITGCSPKSSTEQRAAEAKAKVSKPSPDPTPENAIVCKNCGVVLSVKEIETEGEGSGLGVVAGGVVGGLIGNQVGHGTGRDLATIAGAVGGAFAGNKIEKNSKKTNSYDIKVKMDTGEEHIVHQATAPDVVKGDMVKIENDVIVKKQEQK